MSRRSQTASNAVPMPHVRRIFRDNSSNDRYESSNQDRYEKESSFVSHRQPDRYERHRHDRQEQQQQQRYPHHREHHRDQRESSSFQRYERNDRYDSKQDQRQDQHRQESRFSSVNPSIPTQNNYSVSNVNSNIASNENITEEIVSHRNRWSNQTSLPASLEGVPFALNSLEISAQQLQVYALAVRLEEIQYKIRTGDVCPPTPQRSPSPEPIYDQHGKRTNRRDARYKKRLEEERTRLLSEMIEIQPGFVPPSDYVSYSPRLQDRIWVPSTDYPELNFIGLLIGPRGNTLKKMEFETGAKIAIRGRGSVKEGKANKDVYYQDQDEELHCVISADREEKVMKAVRMIERIIETAASTPEGFNELKRTQLRELAELNGTLREEESHGATVCNQCGQSGHSRLDCPEKSRNVTSSLVCVVCGGAGHLGRDCKSRHGGAAAAAAAIAAKQEKSVVGAVDEAYLSFMADVGGEVETNVNVNNPTTEGNTNELPPWHTMPAPQPTAPTYDATAAYTMNQSTSNTDYYSSSNFVASTVSDPYAHLTAQDPYAAAYQQQYYSTYQNR